MKTFKCWLIANFEIFSFVLTAIIASIIYFGFLGSKTVEAETDQETSDSLAILFAVLFAYFVIFINPTNKNGVSFFKYIVTLGGLILLTWGVKSKGWIMSDPKEVQAIFSRYITYLWIVFSIATVLSGWLAHYTYVNIREVVSRRMLWRNSNVSLFDFSWKYTLDRFCGITISIVLCILPIILFTMLYINNLLL